MSYNTQAHNSRELALNYQVNLEHRANCAPVSNQTRHKKMDRRQEWHRNRGADKDMRCRFQKGWLMCEREGKERLFSRWNRRAKAV